ncbi:Cytochrome d ubiquinol oxidase, subunit II (fragment) [Candidatus Sulfopaludibacter sp. SbA3]
METLWFCLVAAMIAVYVILDGFDLGAGIVHLVVARTDAERRAVLASIGPVWDGNEVWLLAGGGTLYFAFPALYASSFSGFYLPLMMVLWLLILRGIAIEFRNHVRSLVWQPLWDAVFAGASALLAIFFGAALGNVVRGVPLNSAGEFFLPLWTNFAPGQDAGILDWYTVLIGVAALVALTVHGALWVALKTEGDGAARPPGGERRVVGAAGVGDGDHPLQLPPAAAPERELCRASVGLPVSARHDRGTDRHPIPHRPTGIPQFLSFPFRYADQRRLRPVPIRPAFEWRSGAVAQHP